MKLPFFYFKGFFSPDEIKIYYQPVSSRKIDPGLEQKLKKSWEELQESAKKNNKKIWDSQLYRLESFAINPDGSLNISISSMPFSVRKMTSYHLEEVLRLGEEYFSKGLFSSIFVKTTDNLYCFLEKSGKYEARNQFSFVGGAISKSEKVIKSGVDLFWTAEKEIKEELNVDEKNIVKINLISVYITPLTHVCFLFIADLDLTAENLKKRYLVHHHPESSDLILVTLEQIPDFLSERLPGDIAKFDVLKELTA